MDDMAHVIVPKSDQINADDLLSASITIKITDVKVKAGQEQPVSIMFEGSDKAYRPCKSMCRVMVSAWGADTSKYKGRSMTLYCDPKVRWGGMEVGGIRISHMSHIDASMTMALTVTRSNKKPFTVKPLLATKASAAQVGLEPSKSDIAPTVGDSEPATADAPALITPDDALSIEARCNENGIKIAAVKKYFGIERFSQMTQEQLVEANDQIDETLRKRRERAEAESLGSQA
jgi:hypothetical protein